jgi:hypothetical protein
MCQALDSACLLNVFGCRSEIPDLTTEEESDQAAEDSADIVGALLAVKLPGLKLPSEEIHPFDRPVATSHSFDFSALITARRQHETKRAAQGVRVKSQSEELAVVDANAEPTKSEVVKREIKREMNAVLLEHHQKAVGTGLEHLARWQNSLAPGGRSENEVAALMGNSANAELAAGQRASGVCINCSVWLKLMLSRLSADGFKHSLPMAFHKTYQTTYLMVSLVSRVLRMPTMPFFARECLVLCSTSPGWLLLEVGKFCIAHICQTLTMMCTHDSFSIIFSRRRKIWSALVVGRFSESGCGFLYFSTALRTVVQLAVPCCA